MADRWFFSYCIRICNLGEETLQLISRHWIITDANGVIRYEQLVPEITNEPDYAAVFAVVKKVV